MTLLSLFQGEHGLLASERLVFAPEEVEALECGIALCRRMEQLFEEQDGKLARERAEACERGHSAGFAQGLADAEVRSTEQLDALHERHRLAVREQRDRCSRIALEIVRRLAGDVAEADWLAAQAVRAAEELIEQAPLVLHVHPTHLDTVRRALAGPGTGIDSIVADDGLPLDGCSIESGVGRVDASLETQLARLAQLAVIDEASEDQDVGDTFAAGGDR